MSLCDHVMRDLVRNFRKDTDTRIIIIIVIIIIHLYSAFSTRFKGAVYKNESKPQRFLKALLLFFVEPYVVGTRDSEKYFNPDLTKVSVKVNGLLNKTQHMNLTKFYTADKLGLLINLRSMADQAIHSSGTRLMNTKVGVQLELEQNAKGSDNVNCDVLVISDSKTNIIGD